MLRLVEYGAAPPALNMGIDEALVSLPGPPTLRLYSWSPPGLSIGYFQSAGPFRHLAGPHVLVRRLTGGGAIYHDDEITFALTADAARLPARVDDSYELVHAAIARALRAFGVATSAAAAGAPAGARPAEPWCFARPGRHDLVDPSGAKVVGSAQRRLGGPRPRVLHHGSIPLSAPAATPGCGGVGAQADAAALRHQLGPALAAELGAALGLRVEAGELTELELRRAHELAARYRDDAFTSSR